MSDYCMNWFYLFQLPNDLIADYYFTVGVEVTSYDSSPDPPPRDGKVYGKLVSFLTVYKDNSLFFYVLE